MKAWPETSGERTRPRVLPLAASPAAPCPATNSGRSGVRRGRRTRHASRVRSPAIRNLRGAFRNGIVFCAVIAAVWLALPKPPLLDGISFSQCVRDRNGKLLRVTLSADQKFRIWTPLEEISPDLIDATLRYEDKYYVRHPGVNPIALARGAADLLRFHRATTGGSTITMQLARLRFHLHTRTISGKLEQIMRVLETSHGRDQIVTTLDLEKQQAIERRVTDYVANNRNRGIENAAVLLVDTRTMDVVAHIGSADFYKADINGQVDGTRSPRSPGSTLKPFVYALALDQGLIHPLSILADAPRSFGDYNPENFDHEFLGPIRARDALARSRNLPAVELASQLSHPTLYEFLRGAGVALPRSESLYGLALPLGGVEIKMEDLARLYAALSNNGEQRPLRRKAGDPMPGHRHQIVTPEAAFLTLDIP